MADTVQITAGTGTVVGTDEVTIGAVTQHVQRMKLVDGTDGGTELIPGTADKGLVVQPRPKLVRLVVTPVVSTITYAVKDNVGGVMTFANAARVAGGSIRVEEVVISDNALAAKDLELVFFRSSPTATDNAVFDPTDTQINDITGTVLISQGNYSLFNDNNVAHVPVRTAMVLDTVDLYAVLVCRTAFIFSATNDITVALTITQD